MRQAWFLIKSRLFESQLIFVYILGFQILS